MDDLVSFLIVGAVLMVMASACEPTSSTEVAKPVVTKERKIEDISNFSGSSLTISDRTQNLYPTANSQVANISEPGNQTDW